jgi:hypothetical protein
MPSSYTSSLRIELQFTGENVNVWGDRLNTGLQRLDTSIAGLKSIALTGDYALATSNTGEDDSRAAVLKFTGSLSAPAVITLASVSKKYTVWNASGNTLTFTTGAGTAVQVANGDIVDVFCTGSDVKTLGYGGNSLKDYIASVVVGGGASLPSLTGNSGKWLTNNGSLAQWALPTTNDLSDLQAYTAARSAFAIAMAVAFSR